MERPSHKEISKKLRLAKELITQGNISLINPTAIVYDALELGYVVEAELQELLLGLIKNTTHKDYVGYRPPQRSYKKQ